MKDLEFLPDSYQGDGDALLLKVAFDMADVKEYVKVESGTSDEEPSDCHLYKLYQLYHHYLMSEMITIKLVTNSPPSTKLRSMLAWMIGCKMFSQVNVNSQ
ncbi:hypothetical protein CHS0354_020713 [Potamilus streckersoni]|uniref:Uncharacterized protein n=1 Tax=Potamilus streckersoni TaxID=2493646 RepID=A0AAE0VQQ5_9BIVA|nr:hypothetical protein CHS0354_020713 [Potamilus streckersoni]